MNWDALAAAAELLAAIGVIVSLVYLAAQTRPGETLPAVCPDTDEGRAE